MGKETDDVTGQDSDLTPTHLKTMSVGDASATTDEDDEDVTEVLEMI